jgi:O-antigen/teichoic acid export membrane protein
VAAKAMALRMLITIPFFCIMVCLLKNLLWTLIITTCLTSLLAAVFIGLTYSDFCEEGTLSLERVGVLLRTCFPVFAGGFLSFYIGNAPKYAIDAYLDDELQACYGFISMPVFVIGLLNGFILNPMLYGLSRLWNDGKIKEFVGKILMLTCSTFIITLVCVVGAFFVGVPVLSFLYNTDLSPYKTELLVLLLGGGLLALSNVLNIAVVIMRYQKSLLICYAVAALLAFFVSDWMVNNYAIMGAAILYTSLMGVLCLSFAGIMIKGITGP